MKRSKQRRKQNTPQVDLALIASNATQIANLKNENDSLRNEIADRDEEVEDLFATIATLKSHKKKLSRIVRDLSRMVTSSGWVP